MFSPKDTCLTPITDTSGLFMDKGLTSTNNACSYRRPVVLYVHETVEDGDPMRDSPPHSPRSLIMFEADHTF